MNMIKKTTRRMMQKEETRKLYLLAAIEVFRKKGFNVARVKDITNRAGTSVGNFYNYFDNKEHIFEEILKEAFNIITPMIKDLQKYDLPPIKAIKEMYRKYLRIFRDRPNLVLFFIEQMGGINQKYLDMKNVLLQRAIDEAEIVFTRLVERGFIRKQNPKISAAIWINTLICVYQWWAHSNFEVSEEEIIENLVNFLVGGTVK